MSTERVTNLLQLKCAVATLVSTLVAAAVCGNSGRSCLQDFEAASAFNWKSDKHQSAAAGHALGSVTSLR
jgi:hypothetical protein